jgi:K+-transporting ATPase KdpF subunit
VSATDLVGLVLTVLLAGYLLLALVAPDRFR